LFLVLYHTFITGLSQNFQIKVTDRQEIYTLLHIQFTVALIMLYVIQKVTFQFSVKYESCADLSHARTVTE